MMRREEPRFLTVLHDPKAEAAGSKNQYFGGERGHLNGELILEAGGGGGDDTLWLWLSRF